MFNFRKRTIAPFIILLLVPFYSAFAASSVPDLRHPIRAESAATPEVRRTAPLKTSAVVQTSLQSTAAPTQMQNAQAQTAPANLIRNPSLETANGASPAYWHKGGYGANTRTLSYPATPAEEGAAAIAISVSNYQSGDAKWYFDDVSISGGTTYEFSDYYKASAPSIITARYTLSDGSYSYPDLESLPAAASYTKASVTFVAPENAVSLTIFHLLKGNGSLTTDAYSLTEAPGASSNELVANGDFETAATGDMPVGWHRGGWGTNARTFTYPAAGYAGSGAQVSITQSGTGDAKWYFSPVSVSPGIYTYRDEYRANVPSVVTVQFQHQDGSYTYKDIARLPAAPAFTAYSGEFSITADVKAVSVFHLIKSVGSLTLDNVSLTQKSAFTGVFLTGAVTLRFDDGWLSQYQNAAPIMEQDGLTGTFYIVSRQTGDSGYYPGFMTIPQIQDLYAHGMEIGAHTRTHSDLATLSAAQQQNEIAGSRQDILGWNVGPVNSFSYPYGSYNETSLQTVKDAGFRSAAATIDGDVTPTSDSYQLEREIIKSDTSVAQVEQWIQHAMDNHVWLILEIHEVNDSGNAYSTTPARFQQIVDYLVAHNVPVVTVSEGAQSLQ